MTECDIEGNSSNEHFNTYQIVLTELTETRRGSVTCNPLLISLIVHPPSESEIQCWEQAMLMRIDCHQVKKITCQMSTTKSEDRDHFH